MRAVFVNQCHPDTPHVCAVRMREFAAAMARRGHQVVVLTETLRTQDGDHAPDDPAERLAGHDWSAPLHMACDRAGAPLLDRLHQGRLPFGLRQAVVAGHFVLRGGVFAHWTAGSRAAVAALAHGFRPELVWATFGCTDAWNIARRLAAEAGCPWVADLKDNWDNFIPFGLRSVMARRYGDAAHFTALSEAHAEIAAARFGASATVITSGIPRSLPQDPDNDDGSGPFRIVAAGSIYDGSALAAIAEGIGAWLERDGAGRDTEFRYFGNDHERVEAALAPLKGRCRIAVLPFVESAELGEGLARASVIVYPRHRPMLYHHKFIEFLATGRPVLCLPEETGECRAIAARLDAPFFSCGNATDVAAALSVIASGRCPQLNRAALAEYSWDAQSGRLEGVLQQAGRGS